MLIPRSIFSLEHSCLCFSMMVFSRPRSRWATHLVLWTVLFYVACAMNVPIDKDQKNALSLSLETTLDKMNTTLDKELFHQFEFAPLAIKSRNAAQQPYQWRVPDVFRKRQNCQGSSNFCFPGATKDYCPCTAICCTNTASKTGWCCSSASDIICNSEDLNCAWIPYVGLEDDAWTIIRIELISQLVLPPLSLKR